MFRFMLVMSAIFQSMISLVNNERGEVLTDEQIAANEAKVLVEKEAAELKATSKKEALRDLSKELGINAFEPSELKAKFDEFTEWQTSQKSEQEVLQEKYDLLKGKEEEWQTSKLESQGKIEAMRLNIADDNLADALKLAGGDPSKLEEVVKKYPIFKSEKGIVIGVHNNNGSNDINGLSEAEKYMALHPELYKK